MAARIQVRESDVINANGTRDDVNPDTPCYWSAENHGTGSLLRMEHWASDPAVRAHMLPSRARLQVPIPPESAVAILRYREEVKMYAALEDEKRSNDGLETVMTDPSFLDEHHERILSEWPESRTRGPWLDALHVLRDHIDRALDINDSKDISQEDQAKDAPCKRYFIKLSVRSPKDAPFAVQRTRQMLERLVQEEEPPLSPEDPMRLSADVCMLKNVAWHGMAVRNGDEALELLLRSDRAYIDLLQAELFASHQRQPVQMDLHISDFCADFDPGWEFRGFVDHGKRTCLTVYNPWTYDPDIVTQKPHILQLIEQVWDVVDAAMQGRSQGYCADFAVTRDMQHCYLIEINDFLPPLAGTGLFSLSSPQDCNVLRHGPFEFRVREERIVADDLIQRRVGERGDVTLVEAHVAPPDVVRFLHECRCRRLGIPLPTPINKTCQQDTGGGTGEHMCAIM